jgi:hypothetical protein
VNGSSGRLNLLNTFRQITRPYGERLLQEANTRKPLTNRQYATYTILVILFAIFIDTALILYAWLPLGGLPKDIPQNATIATAITTVTQRVEISKLSTWILTVEGLLLGLSPILFDKIGAVRSAITVSITAIGLLLSLITVASADTSVDFAIAYQLYVAALGIFGVVVILYVGAAWIMAFSKKSC